MSNTSITPSVGSVSLAGVAGAMGLTPFMTGAALALAGVAPTITDVGAVAPGTEGKPISWSNLLANAVGATVGPVSWLQARFVASGVFGSGGALMVDVSPDGNTWTPAAAITDPVAPGLGLLDSPSMRAVAIPGGIVLIASDVTQGPYLRTRVVGGDGSTRLSVSASANPRGAC